MDEKTKDKTVTKTMEVQEATQDTEEPKTDTFTRELKPKSQAHMKPIKLKEKQEAKEIGSKDYHAFDLEGKEHINKYSSKTKKKKAYQQRVRRVVR